MSLPAIQAQQNRARGQIIRVEVPFGTRLELPDTIYNNTSSIGDALGLLVTLLKMGQGRRSFDIDQTELIAHMGVGRDRFLGWKRHLTRLSYLRCSRRNSPINGEFAWVWQIFESPQDYKRAEQLGLFDELERDAFAPHTGNPAMGRPSTGKPSMGQPLTGNPSMDATPDSAKADSPRAPIHGMGMGAPNGPNPGRERAVWSHDGAGSRRKASGAGALGTPSNQAESGRATRKIGDALVRCTATGVRPMPRATAEQLERWYYGDASIEPADLLALCGVDGMNRERALAWLKPRRIVMAARAVINKARRNEPIGDFGALLSTYLLAKSKNDDFTVDGLKLRDLDKLRRMKS